MTIKPAFPALGAPIRRGRMGALLEDLALPKSLKSRNFTLANTVIQWMSVQDPA
jgi:hypothetical protein